MRRRKFLITLPRVVLAGSGFAVFPLEGSDGLLVLNPNNLERLKLDFNANKDKVRLLFLLSPT